jgi:hypothetical protein
VVIVVASKKYLLSQQQFVEETRLMDLFLDHKVILVSKLAIQDQNQLHPHVLKEMIQTPIQPVKSMDKMEMIWKSKKMKLMVSMTMGAKRPYKMVIMLTTMVVQMT